MNVLYARIQQRNVFEFDFDVEVFVDEVCDERRQNSAMGSKFMSSSGHASNEFLLGDKQIIKQNCIGIVQTVHFARNNLLCDVSTVELKTSLNLFLTLTSSRL